MSRLITMHAKNVLIAVLMVVLIGMAPVVPVAIPVVAQEATTAHQPAAAPNQIFLPLVNGSGAGSIPQVTYEVAYQDNTVVIDEHTMTDKLKSVSEDKVEYRFDTSATTVAELQPGQIVIFSGLAVRKVVRRLRKR